MACRILFVVAPVAGGVGDTAMLEAVQRKVIVLLAPSSAPYEEGQPGGGFATPLGVPVVLSGVESKDLLKLADQRKLAEGAQAMTDQRKKQIKDAIASMDSAARKKASKSSPGDPVIGKESVPTDAEMEAIFAANPDLATRAIEGASQAGAIAPAKHERSEDLTGETPKDKESDVPAEDRKHSLPTLGPQPKKLKR